MTPSDAQRPRGVRRERVSTTDPGEADELMRAAYTEHRATTFGDPERFAFDMTTVSVGALQIARTRHSMGFVASSAPADGKLIALHQDESARLHMTCRDEQASAPAMLAPTWAPFTARWDDIEFGSTTLDEAQVARVGAELSGLAPGAVGFTGMTPVSPALGRYWQALTAHVARDFLALDSPPPLLVAEVVHRLAVGLLMAFPNTTHRVGSPPDPGDGAPATVRRAVEFIDAHAGEAIDLVQIADAARIGPRALQAAFRRHRDQTPLEYLRRVRMDRAHRDLQAGDPTRGDTVAAIAARWGFGHPGRFAVEYARLYGRSPSDTLRR